MSSFVPVTLRPSLTWFQPNAGCDGLRIEVSNYGDVCMLLVVFGHSEFSARPAVVNLPQSRGYGKLRLGRPKIRLEPDIVVHCGNDLLPGTKIAFGRLSGSMPEKKLNGTYGCCVVQR